MAHHPEQSQVGTSPADAAIADYLEEVDRGEPVNRQEFLNKYPGLAEELSSFFDSIDEIDQLIERGQQRESALNASDPPASIPVGANSIDTSRIAGHTPSETKRAERVRIVPEIIERYRIVRCLGEGGMGSVYLARDMLLNRSVALKIPHTAALDEPGRRERFLREAQAAANLHHPNICQVFDVGEVDGIPYITMTYLEGVPLASQLAEWRFKPPRETVALVSQIASALQDAHSHGIVHRDLKPANIMINRRNEPVIMDFGLALQVNEFRDARVTKPGTVMGTPAYMSPEQITGDPSAVGAASDIYSLGVILFELLVGRLPFQGSAAEIMANVLKDDAPAPSSVRPDLDPELDAICRRMLAKLVQDRYPDMAAVTRDLRSYLRSSRSAVESFSNSELELPLVLDESRATPATVTIRQEPSVKGHAAPAGEKKWRRLAASAVFLILLIALPAVAVLLGRDDHRVRFQVDETVPGDLEVRVDGQRVETRDLTAGLRLEPGHEHNWAIWRGDDAMLRSETFTVAQGENPAIEITLRQDAPRETTLVPPRTATPEHARKLPHVEGVSALAMSSDGTTVAVASGKSIHLWNYIQGLEIREITPADKGEITALAFDPTGNMLAVGGKSRVRVLDPASATEVRVLDYKGTNVNSLAYSRDGRLLAAASRGGNITVWHMGGQGEPMEIADSAGVESMAFSPDGRVLASVHANGEAVLWDSTNGARKLQIKAHSDKRTYGIAFSPDGMTFATGADEGLLKLWDAASGNELRQFVGHGNAVASVAIHPNGRFLASSGSDNTLRLWAIETGDEIHRMTFRTAPAGMAFSSNGQMLAIALADGVDLWQLPVSMVVSEKPGLLAELLDHKGYVNTVSFSPDNRYLATAGRGKPGADESQDSDVRIWDLASQKVVRRLSSKANSIQKVRFAPDGKTVVAMSDNGLFQFWDAATGERTRDFGGVGVGPIGPGIVRDFAFLPGDTRLVSVGTEGHQIIRLEDLRVVSHWKSNDDLGSVATFSDGRSNWLLSGSIRSGQITRWNASLAEEVAVWKASNSYADFLDVTPDGRWGLSGAAGTYEIWNLQEPSEQSPVHRWERVGVTGPHYHQRVGAISPDGSRVLLTTQADPPAAILIDAASGEPEQEFLGHAGSAIITVAISPDGNLAASGGLDGKVLLWRLPEQIDRERRAAEWVLKMGGQLLTGTTAQTTKEIRQSSDLEEDSIICRSITLLNNPLVTDDSLKNLAGLRGLEELRLAGTSVTDAGLKYLKGLPRLRYLNLDGTQVSDAAIASIAEFKNLEQLSLQNTRLTGTAFPDLIPCRNLKILVLSGTGVTDQHIPYLNGLPELEDLYLGRTQITDGCVKHLLKLKRLRLFDYQGSQMTEAGVRELKQSRPDLLLLPDK